ncbi:MAG: lipid-A-disaccharide synthase [Spirochaetia bacterium]|nr:lipid-A-disaccharide synthase [Spirochaetia bacterium]
MSRSILIVAGETSGDILGAAIIGQFKKLSAEKYAFWGFGGSTMNQAGIEITKDIQELSVIGFWEAIINYRRLSNYLDKLVIEAQKKKITAAILIDYPGFNLKLAEKLSAFNIPVYQVVSPQVWAWHFSRIYKIKKFIKAVLCLYKFELNIYKEKGIPATFIGHPIVQKVNDFKHKHKIEITKIKKNLKNIKKIALLPGSRTSEIKRHLPFLIDAAIQFNKKHPETIFEIPSASDHTSKLIKEYGLPEFVSVRSDAPYITLATSDSGIVCSGTATLECALFNLPFLLIYKTSWLTYFLGKRLIKLPYIGLVNILNNGFITKEFIQSDMKSKPVLNELEKINYDHMYIKNMIHAFDKVKAEVSSKNPAITAAQFFIKNL